MVAIFSPFCSWSLCISASHRGIRQCPCPCHRGIHFQPSRFHTGKKNETPQDWIKEKKHLEFWVKKKENWCYLTSDGAVPLWDTLGVDITRVGQAVAAADLRLAALHLIPCEAGLAAAAVVGALRTSKTHLVSALNGNCKEGTRSGAENRVVSRSDIIWPFLPQSCDTASRGCSRRCRALCIRRCRRRPEIKQGCNLKPVFLSVLRKRACDVEDRLFDHRPALVTAMAHKKKTLWCFRFWRPVIYYQLPPNFFPTRKSHMVSFRLTINHKRWPEGGNYPELGVQNMFTDSTNKQSEKHWTVWTPLLWDLKRISTEDPEVVQLNHQHLL